MSVTFSPSQPVSSVASPEETDGSCRAPVLLLFASSAAWLVIASGLELIASLKFHMPGLLAACPWSTYGRVQPAQLNALVYGFAAQAALGVALWLVARLGKTILALAGVVTVGAVFWNVGVTLGILGILAGDSTGYEWLEMPRYASPVLFAAYAVIGLAALLTFLHRREAPLQASQWFLLAALFWFPWIYSTANLLLVFAPVRGMMQAVVAWWYVGNLTNIWFGFIGLAVLFHFIPQLAGRPLHSYYLAMFAFWTLALFGGWGNIPHSAPVPAWLPSLSTVFAVLTVLPMIAIAMNLRQTLAGQSAKIKESLPLRLCAFSVTAYVLAGLLNVLVALDWVQNIVHFTFFMPALRQLFLFGFVGLATFAAIYYIVPRLMGSEFPSAGLVKFHVTFTLAGLALYLISLAVGGVLQGRTLNDPNVAFMDTLKPVLMFFRLSTLGDLLLLAGNLALLLNFVRLFARCCRTCCVPVVVAATNPQIAEAAR
jgi:cytochrome c oxidase cbb3-type subunit 1